MSERVRLIEIDRMTGNDRELPNFGGPGHDGTWTREDAEANVAWREEHITGRYGYEIVSVPASSEEQN